MNDKCIKERLRWYIFILSRNENEEKEEENKMKKREKKMQPFVNIMSKVFINIQYVQKKNQNEHPSTTKQRKCVVRAKICGFDLSRAVAISSVRLSEACCYFQHQQSLNSGSLFVIATLENPFCQQFFFSVGLTKIRCRSTEVTHATEVTQSISERRYHN